jgi:hypothetical protein
MGFVKADRVNETSTTTGTGNLTLAGAAAANLRRFGAVMAAGDFCYGFVAARGLADWEVNTFTMQSDGTLARGTPFASSNGGALVSFAGGIKDVVMDAPAGDTASLANGNTFAGTPNTFQKGPLTVYAGADAVTALVVNCNGASQTAPPLLVNDKNNARALVVHAGGGVGVGVGTNTPSALTAAAVVQDADLGYTNIRLGQDAFNTPCFYLENPGHQTWKWTNTLGELGFIKPGVAFLVRFATDGSVAVGPNAVDPSAQLDLQLNTKGFLPPRLTTAQRDAVSGPAEGLLIYNTTLHKLQIRAAAAWETVTSS